MGLKLIRPLSSSRGDIGELFEQRTETGSLYFSCLGSGLSEVCKLIVSTSEKILNDINVVVTRQVKVENSLLPLAVEEEFSIISGSQE